jgi:hypothetical protein
LEFADGYGIPAIAAIQHAASFHGGLCGQRKSDPDNPAAETGAWHVACRIFVEFAEFDE